MKRNYIQIAIAAASVFTLASCDVNKPLEFDDADAFIALSSQTAGVAENGRSINIPVTLASAGLLTGAVDFEMVAPETSAAVEGVHYTVANPSKTLHFSGEEFTQYITLNIIDNNTFNGDVKLTINLKNPVGATLGATKSCTVTIQDDEHPLAFILGSLAGTGASYWGDALTWTATFEKDADDVSKVWITDLVPAPFSESLPIYSTVNEEKTEIHIPVGQTLGTYGSYDIKLEGFYDAEGEEEIPAGGYLTGVIAEDGTITMQNMYGAGAYSAASGAWAGWLEIVLPNAVYKK